MEHSVWKFPKMSYFFTNPTSPSNQISRTFQIFDFGGISVQLLGLQRCKIVAFHGKDLKWDFFEWFSNTMHGNEPYLETSRRHQTYLFSNKHRRSWRQKNTYSSDTQYTVSQVRAFPIKFQNSRVPEEGNTRPLLILNFEYYHWTCENFKNTI